MLYSQRLGTRNLEISTFIAFKTTGNWGKIVLNGHPTQNSNSGTRAAFQSSDFPTLKISEVMIWPRVFLSLQLFERGIISQSLEVTGSYFWCFQENWELGKTLGQTMTSVIFSSKSRVLERCRSFRLGILCWVTVQSHFSSLRYFFPELQIVLSARNLDISELGIPRCFVHGIWAEGSNRGWTTTNLFQSSLHMYLKQSLIYPKMSKCRLID